MTSPLRMLPVLLPVALLGSAFLAAPASAQNDARAVAQCRAELERQCPAGVLRSHRIASIRGNSRRVTVSIVASADRRYTFECVTDGSGAVQTAALSPPANTRLAGAQPSAQGQ